MKKIHLTLAVEDVLSEMVEPAPQHGATSKQGPDYNGRLTRFVRENWDVHTARNNSKSLNSAFVRLEGFKPAIP